MGVIVFGTVGGWLGAALDHGNWFGLASILIGTIGSFFGIWVGYKVGQNLGI